MNVITLHLFSFEITIYQPSSAHELVMNAHTIANPVAYYYIDRNLPHSGT